MICYMTLFHCSVDPKRVQFFTSLSSPKVAKRGIFDEAFHHHLCTLNYPQTVCTTNIKESKNLLTKQIFLQNYNIYKITRFT